jgi:drug/metabolite transporter (DMT)-like permease
LDPFVQSAVLIFFVLALTVFGQLIIKARANLHTSELGLAYHKAGYLFAMMTDIWVLSGLAAAVVAGMCWMVAVQKLDVGFAYPFMALSFVLVPVSAAILLKEPLPPVQFIGLGLIIAGVAVSSLTR